MNFIYLWKFQVHQSIFFKLIVDQTPSLPFLSALQRFLVSFNSLFWISSSNFTVSGHCHCSYQLFWVKNSAPNNWQSHQPSHGHCYDRYTSSFYCHKLIFCCNKWFPTHHNHSSERWRPYWILETKCLCMSSGIHMRSWNQSFPVELSIVSRRLMFFTVLVHGFNVVADPYVFHFSVTLNNG